MFTSLIYAAEVGEATKAGGASSIMSIAPMIVIWGAIFYFVLIRPQGKRKKEHQTMMNEIKVGDEIITSSGIKGEVVSKNDEFYEIRVDKGVKLTIKTSAISSIYKSK